MRDLLGLAGIAGSVVVPFEWLALPIAAVCTFAIVYRRLRWAKYEVLSAAVIRRRR